MNLLWRLLWLLSYISFSQCSDPSLLAKFHSFWTSKHTFHRDERIDLLVNSATSQTSNRNIGYYRLPFVCPNSSNAKPVHLSVAEIINGDRFWQSDYKLAFLKDEPCLRICDRVMNQRTIERSVEIIKDDYIAHWVIDGIPASTTFINDDGISGPKKYYIPGFSLGYEQDGDAYLNNHVMIVIRYHKESDPEKYSIVGVEVYPKSVNDAVCPGASRNYEHLKLNPDQEDQLVPFTYSIYWREDPDLEHKDRWKMYIDPSSIDENGNVKQTPSKNTAIHWVSLINSFVVLSFVSIIVAFVLLTTFRSNFASESASEFSQVAQSSFVPPIFLNLLSILTGSGIQFIFTLLGSGLLSFVFFRNTFGQQTTIFSAVIAVLIIGGFFAGFSSIQLFKLFNTSSGELSLKKTIIISSLSGSALISLSLIVVVIANILVFDSGSPRSFKFGTFMCLFVLYVVLQIPISVIGGIISKNFNLLTKSLAKKMPDFVSSSVSLRKNSGKPSPSSSSTNYPFYLKLPFSLLILGICPCSIVFIESRFLYVALLVERASTSYFMYGFIISAAILLLVVMVEIGIIATYLRLLKVGSQVNWQWWTFLSCSFSIWIYLVPLSIYHLIFKMKLLDSGSPVLYMVYTTILNTVVSIACGSLALWSATMFVYAVVYSAGTKED